MHLAEHLDVAEPYTARPYRGEEDLPAMHRSLVEYRRHHGDQAQPTLAEMTSTYRHLSESDTARDVAVVETIDGEPVGYVRTGVNDLGTGVRDCILFDPIRPAHLAEPLFGAIVAGQEAHLRPAAAEAERARLRAYSSHPGPGRQAAGEALWLERRGYVATEWSASLVRPTLDDIPERPLPDGVEVRPVRPDHLRRIWESHEEAFRGEWDFREPSEEDFLAFVESPLRDESLWKVAWVGDQVVGQVKPFVNADENAELGRRRGYTEFISTHRDWRGRGIAGALLAMSLRELRDRGFTEAALGVDTNNPGGAFQLYTSLGFELRTYEAVYTRAFDRDPS